jgi:voltage-gated potassium channel
MPPPGRLRTNLRFGRFLLAEFRRPLAVFVTLVLAGGWVFHEFYHARQVRYAEACYAVFQLLFFQGQLEFPQEWYLQVLFYLLPILGLWALADAIGRLGYLIFARKRNLPEWQQMVASMYRNHFVIVGVGKVGYRVIKALAEQRESVVAVERRTESEYLELIRDLGVPVITGNARNRRTLELAGVAEARSLVAATDDDLTNLDAALTARDINPKVRVVVRLFDDTLAAKFAGTFDLAALSASQVSAPAFVAAATGRKVYHDFQLDGQHLHLTDLTVLPGGALAGRTVSQVQTAHAVNIVMHRGPQGVNINPAHGVTLGPGDTLLVIAPMDRLLELEAANGSKGS